MKFISCPYTHEDEAVVAQRYKDLCFIVGQLLKKGDFCISPNIFGHAVAEHVKDLPTDWEFWKSYCYAYLEKCDAMYVIMMNGWVKSTGVQAEIKKAISMGIPIIYIDPKDYIK